MTLAKGKRRIQVAVSEEMYEKISKYCDEAGITKSAYMSMLAAKDLRDTDEFLVEFKRELEGVISRLKIEN